MRDARSATPRLRPSTWVIRARFDPLTRGARSVIEYADNLKMTIALFRSPPSGHVLFNAARMSLHANLLIAFRSPHAGHLLCNSRTSLPTSPSFCRFDPLDRDTRSATTYTAELAHDPMWFRSPETGHWLFNTRIAPARTELFRSPESG